MIVSQASSVDVIDPISIQALESRLLGSLVRPGDDEYDVARQSRNMLHDRFPAFVVRAADAADVIRAVEFARENKLRLAVRSGGHSLPGHSSIDDSLVIDLSGLKSVSVDPVGQTVWVQPGATTGDLVAAAQPYGLALSTGDTASVGIGGLTVGGGIGWLVRKHGLTIDSLLSTEIVTADGRLLVANESQHADLFWAVRGGGGNFGIVTAFEFRLHPVGMILGGAIILPPTAEVLSGYAKYASQARDELTTIGVVMAAPPLPFIPQEAHGKLAFVVLFCYAGDVEEGRRAVDSIRTLAEPIGQLISPMPYAALYEFTAQASARHPGIVRSGFMDDLSDAAIEAMLDHHRRRPAPAGMVQLRPLGGALARIPNEATAFAHRDKPMFMAIVNIGVTEEDHLWVTDLWRTLQPMTSGAYVNFLDDEGEGRIRDSYPGETYARLAEVKRRYDPTNFFSLNQNIKPGN